MSGNEATYVVKMGLFGPKEHLRGPNANQAYLRLLQVFIERSGLTTGYIHEATGRFRVHWTLNVRAGHFPRTS